MDEPRIQSATASSQRIPSTRSWQRRRIQHRQRARGHKKRTGKRNEKGKESGEQGRALESRPADDKTPRPSLP